MLPFRGQTLWWIKPSIIYFDNIDDAVDTHADEANAIITTAYTKIRDIIQQDGGKRVTQHTFQILGVMQDLVKQLQPTSLELRQIAEKYEVEKRVNEGMAAAAALRDATMARLPDLYGQLRQKVRLSLHIFLFFYKMC